MYDKRTDRLRPALRAVAVTLSVSLGSAAVPAAALELPPIKAPPVTTPPVKTPPVKVPAPPPVKTPPVKVPAPPPVKVPPVKVPAPPPLKAPPVKVPPVKVPPVTVPPVKVPTAPVKTPPVSVPTPVKVPPVAVPPVKPPQLKAPPLKAPPLQAPPVKLPPAAKVPSPKPSVSPSLGGRLPAGSPGMPVAVPAPHVSVQTVSSDATARLRRTSSSSRPLAQLSYADGSPSSPDGVASSSATMLSSALDGSPTGGESAGYGGSAELPDLARLLAAGHGKLDSARLRAVVLSLRGCVPAVAPRLRTVLLLRSGLERPHPLSTAALAIRLRISRRHVRSLEVKALRALLHAARTTGCARAEQRAAPGIFFASYLAGASGTPSPAFGVESAHEERSPAARGPAPGTVRPPASLGLSPGSSAFWLLCAVLIALIVIAVGVLDNLGIGPRHRYRGGIRRRK